MHSRWVAAQRLRLERTRPSTPGGDLQAERRLYRAVAAGVRVPDGGASALAQRTQVIDAEVAPRSAAARPRWCSSAWATTAAPCGSAGAVCAGSRWTAPPSRRTNAAGCSHSTSRPPRRRTSRSTWAADDLASALEAAGHDAGVPSLFVAEAIFAALTLEAAAAVCSASRARARPGSALVATFPISPEGGELTRALRAAGGLVRQATGERPRHEFRPGDPQKLLVVTGWRVTHSESSPERRLDPGAHQLVVVCEPGA